METSRVTSFLFPHIEGPTIWDIPKSHSLGYLWKSVFLWQLFIISTGISSPAIIHFQVFPSLCPCPKYQSCSDHYKITGNLSISKYWMHFWFENGLDAQAPTTQLFSLQLGGAVCDGGNVSWEVLLTPLFLERDWRSWHLYVQKASHFVILVLWCCQASLNCEKLRGNSYSTENILCSVKQEHDIGVELSALQNWTCDVANRENHQEDSAKIFHPTTKPFHCFPYNTGPPEFLCHWKRHWFGKLGPGCMS